MKFRLFLAFALCTALFSCEKHSVDADGSVAYGTYILNNGNWGGNDANIGVYDPVSKTFKADQFFAVNGQMLGDLGQDIIRVDDKVYVAVNGSQTIFVTDEDLKIVKQVDASNAGAKLSPRYLTAFGKTVYVTYYEGFVGEISSEDYSVKLCQVGSNPEGIAIAGDKLYTADSGGMVQGFANTLSVVSLSDFKKVSSIEVNVNPAKVEASSDGKYLYVSSFGNYADIPAKLQVVDLASGCVSDLDYSSVSAIAKGKNDVLYVLCGGYDENWNPLPGTIYRHDMARNLPLGAFGTGTDISFDASVGKAAASEQGAITFPNAYSISAASDGYIYVGCSDYVNTGDVYVLTSTGTLHDKFDSQGLNPVRAY